MEISALAAAAGARAITAAAALSKGWGGLPEIDGPGARAIAADGVEIPGEIEVGAIGRGRGSRGVEDDAMTTDLVGDDPQAAARRGEEGADLRAALHVGRGAQIERARALGATRERDVEARAEEDAARAAIGDDWRQNAELIGPRSQRIGRAKTGTPKSSTREAHQEIAGR